MVSGQCPRWIDALLSAVAAKRTLVFSVVLIPGVGRECRKVATSIVVGKVLVDSLGLDFSDGEMLGWIIGRHGV